MPKRPKAYLVFYYCPDGSISMLGIALSRAGARAIIKADKTEWPDGISPADYIIEGLYLTLLEGEGIYK